jgi:hypothetical protein
MATATSGPGTGFKDLLPLPSDAQVVTDPEKEETSASLSGGATLSHSLAHDDHQEVKGLAQLSHGRKQDNDVRDLGWNEKKQHVAEPLVGGMDNEELWMLIRRFNKACTCPCYYLIPYTNGKSHSKCIMSKLLHTLFREG